VGEKLLRQFEVTDIKRGGLGIVYILYNPESKGFYAFKSFQERYFKDRRVVEDFYREAETWVKLDKHRNIVEAIHVAQIEGKPHILLEYVDGGTLRQKITGHRLDLAGSLSYAIQFCQGMMNAKYIELDGKEKGIVHRDVKPENIMLTKEDVVKITDFGLVKALGAPSVESPAGTPEYMSPEQFVTMDVDTMADIYSLGVVLYEMLTGRPPFYIWTEDKRERWMFCKRHHWETKPKPPRQIDPAIPGKLETVVLRCLEKRPENRYPSFKDLREELMDIYRIHFREIPETYKETVKKSVAERMYDVGASLKRLGKQEEAIQYFERALETDRRCALAWAGLGAILDDLGKVSDALRCYDRALEIDPQLSHVLNNKGVSLDRLNKLDRALKCYEKALEIDPKYSAAWANKAHVLERLGRADEAIKCYDKALEVDPKHGPAWLGKGNLLFELDRFKEALPCFDKVLEREGTQVRVGNITRTINMRAHDADILSKKGTCLFLLNKADEALLCFERAIQIEAPFEDAFVWVCKGTCLERLGRFEEAIECCDKALEYEPQNAGAWILKASCLRSLGRFEESKRCYEKAMKLQSRTDR